MGNIRYMRKIKKLTAVILCFVTCISLNNRVFTKQSYGMGFLEDMCENEESDTVDTGAKISSEVYESTPDADGRRLIYIVRKSIPKEEIDDAFYEKYGFETSDYEDMETYQNKTVPRLTKEIEEKYGKENASSSSYGFELYGEEISPLDYELTEDYNDYILNSRAVKKALYLSYNGDFFEKNSIDRESVLYNGWYTGSIIMYADEPMIKKLAECDEVVEIALWIMEKIEPALCNVNEQIGTDYSTGTKSTGYNLGQGCNGMGVKIGILEGNSGRFSESAPQLSSIVGTRLFFLDNVDENGNRLVTPWVAPHATYVTSIIVGQRTTLNGRTYEGIVPKATVYQVPMYVNRDFVSGIMVLIDHGVSIINFSGGVNSGEKYYHLYDQEVDRLITENGVTFVVAAGNAGDSSGNVGSPGKAYGAITVGNAATKDSSGFSLTAPYEMHPTSSYKEADYLTNKPDIAAPGTYIYHIDKDGNAKAEYGTSFAAPVVTGIIAQLYGCDRYVNMSPMISKAVLLAGADPSKISTTDNPTKGNAYIREKSGAGLADAISSVEIAMSKQYEEYTFNLSSENTPSDRTRTVSLKAEQKIRVVMTFDKPEDITLTDAYGNDVDLYLVNSAGNIVASSTSSRNNVEILEYTPSADGTYTIRTRLVKKIASSTAVLKAAIAWTFSDNKMRVIFNYNGGSGPLFSMPVYKGKAYGGLPNYGRSGYKLVGWFMNQYYDDVEITSSSIVTKSENHILYAHWAKTYKITNLGSRKCLNIYGDNLTSLNNDINVTLWSDSGTNEQKWLIVGTGYQKYIRSAIDKNYGLNVYLSGNPYNCNIHKIIGNETDAQMDIIPVSGGYKIKLHNYDLYLTAASSSDGANVYWTSLSSSSYQLWTLTEV